MSRDAGDIAADDVAVDAVQSEWAAVLDALERDLTTTVVSASDATAPATPPTAAEVPDATAWTEPTTLGPVPRALVGRASRLLAAQRDRLEELETERRQTLEHLGALRQVAATDEPRGSVYLDASA
ncbi:hypothetical protein NS263_05990 [Curtobacterium oceanosedimentum]|uniref:Uncharacterized protein n=1 Tax=Curtobacterium oceanosedimentum TaxID=465820 RepID=A0ABR5S7M5_9MICO|nr:hypothetical protein [Curtobacterium oceanosedimentum]KTR40990.1 hypothetical protein NS263_05990 [Curtobacterium oceanosedimentum]